MNIKANNKVTVLSDTLKEFFGDKMNLARIKFFGLFISALCKVQTVCFEKLACSFECDARAESSLRRIQRFISEFSLDTDLVARFIFALLPHDPPYRLALDRTNWKLGDRNINILTLGIVYKGLAFPLLFHVMPKYIIWEKKRRHEEEFPRDCKRAFDLGVKFAGATRIES